jgi:hypothetical protein
VHVVSLQVFSPTQTSPKSRVHTNCCLWTLYRARSGLETDLIPPPHNGEIGPRFADQYTKQYLWSLDTIFGVRRVVYLEADMLVRRNFDKLFDLPFPFAAVQLLITNVFPSHKLQ